MQRGGFVYIMTNGNNTFLYIRINTHKRNKTLFFLKNLRSKHKYLGIFFYNDESIVQHIFEIFDVQKHGSCELLARA